MQIHIVVFVSHRTPTEEEKLQGLFMIKVLKKETKFNSKATAMSSAPVERRIGVNHARKAWARDQLLSARGRHEEQESETLQQRRDRIQLEVRSHSPENTEGEEARRL